MRRDWSPGSRLAPNSQGETLQTSVFFFIYVHERTICGQFILGDLADTVKANSTTAAGKRCWFFSAKPSIFLIVVWWWLNVLADRTVTQSKAHAKVSLFSIEFRLISSCFFFFILSLFLSTSDKDKRFISLKWSSENGADLISALHHSPFSCLLFSAHTLFLSSFFLLPDFLPHSLNHQRDACAKLSPPDSSTQQHHASHFI